jgi:hypothetical protein
MKEGFGMQADVAELDAGCGSDAAPKGSNGKVRLLSIDDLDGRTKAAQRARETQDDVLADLGGVENLSTLERLAASHVSVADAMITDVGVRWLRGDPVDPTAFATLVNTFNRSAAALGWTRRAKDVTPADDVSQWIEGRLAAKRKGADEPAADASAETAGDGTRVSDSPSGSDGQSDVAGVTRPASGEATRGADSLAAASPVSSEGGGDHG